MKQKEILETGLSQMLLYIELNEVVRQKIAAMRKDNFELASKFLVRQREIEAMILPADELRKIRETLQQTP
jgi:hypothetical protein